MKIIISNIKMPIKHSINDVFETAQEIVRLHCDIIKNPLIYKKSIDARHKNSITFLYSVILEVNDDNTLEFGSNIKECKDFFPDIISKKSNRKSVYIVGCGPCGLFSAYILALNGYAPIILERGSNVDERQKKINQFWTEQLLNENTNIQFGEGGAGTFSDGKLNTRINDPLQRFVLGTFVENGAPNDIIFNAKPHIGTDYLCKTIKNIRQKIIKLGGKVLFNTKLTDIIIENGKIKYIKYNGEVHSCENLILAIGHSSRDTYEMLYKKKIYMEPKAFAAGVRIEHKREFINKIQYGKEYANPNLPTADYRLAYNGTERNCYSFCMCPGGHIVNASSEKGGLVINGMSEHRRMAENSNSALVVTVKESDFDDSTALSGVEFQRKYEKLAFLCGGGNYSAPVQLAKDFIENKKSKQFESVNPSFTGKTGFSDLRECLPEFITDTLKEGLKYFEKIMPGYVKNGAILTGVEMRTSAPLRIKRNENMESINVSGLYPAGEGAGYAGGIMSAAIDGIKTAQAIIKKN